MPVFVIALTILNSRIADMLVTAILGFAAKVVVPVPS
jgi:hypothetical protein